jgi:hypothetical protein
MSEFDLDMDHFQENPHIMIKSLKRAILDKLDSFSCGGFQASNMAKSGAQLAAENPGGPAPLLLPAYITITQQMTTPQSKAATESNLIHTALTRACAGVKAAFIKTVGKVIIDNLLEDAEAGTRSETLGDLVFKCVKQLDTPSSELLNATVANISTYDSTHTVLENFSSFKRRIAFCVSHDRLTARGDQVAVLYDLCTNAGFPLIQILLDWRKLHADNTWANQSAGGFSLLPFYNYVQAQILLYPATTATAGYTAVGMSFHTASATTKLDADMATLQAKIQSLTDQLAKSGGMSTNTKLPPIDSVWIAAQKEPANFVKGLRRYCYKDGYDTHHGYKCWGMHHLKEYTNAMKAAQNDSVVLNGTNRKPTPPSTKNK